VIHYLNLVKMVIQYVVRVINVVLPLVNGSVVLVMERRSHVLVHHKDLSDKLVVRDVSLLNALHLLTAVIMKTQHMMPMAVN